ncbi:RNA polymerase sigma factor [Synoicihabitans lomoniglobus]|uniref:RNA polymerase sigma factor n=1 Tax=Synoicihabitans lomoniglobus TaxID=2909285 RepID=A0AAF0CNR0_9BACT|nr:RNA polymerase sigma factor [Opitutaceae bacterium LMO-M01]WED64866.1 RNA polymerase sigma factor [Opitutaceae bacterium LMO-M01]
MPSARPSPASDSASEIDLLNAGFRYAVALVHHRQDAEDIAQEAWLNLHRRYGKVPSRALLFTTVKHLVIDRHRRGKIVSFESGEDLVVPDQSTANAPGVATDIDTLLGELRQNEREALFLHYIEGRTAEEIGRMTAQPRNTVLSLMRRSLQKLRRVISPDAPPASPRTARPSV